MPYDPIIDRLIAAFPACFSRLDPKPLKIGLGEALLALAGAHPALADLSRTGIRRALQCYARRPAYRRALAAGGPRYDLDGQAAGEVTPEQQAFARTPRKPSPASPAADPDARPMDFTALLQEVIAMAIPGKLDLTLKINQLPQAKPASPGTMLFAVRADGCTVVVELKNKAWNNLKTAAETYPQWVAALSGKLGEAIASGFRLENPTVQVFERKAKPDAAAPPPSPAMERPKLSLKGRP